MSCFSSLFGTSTSKDLTATRSQVHDIITSNAVAVFAKSYCPYCKATKALLNKEGANFFSIDLDKTSGGGDIKAVLRELTGQNTVPNIFIGGRHIGGNSELQARKEELPEMLRRVGAI